MLRTVLFCLGVSIGVMQPAVGQSVKIGEASYSLSPKGSDNAPPSAPHRTEEMLKSAAQTNQWYSTLLFDTKPQAIFAQPLTVKAATEGFEVGLPSKEVVPTWRRDTEIHYPHKDPLIVRPAAFPLQTAKLAKAGDWSIDIAMGGGDSRMNATVAHGSPFVYFTLSRGDIQIVAPAGGARVAGTPQGNQLVISAQNKRYVVFAPQDAVWEAGAAGSWTGRLPAGKGYFSIAALPDAKPETLELFSKHAYAFIRDTRVAWQYDQTSSTVNTQFSATTQAMEGANTTAILGLYPHHWHQNTSVADRLGAGYDTVRGNIKTLVANEFKTSSRYLSWVPFWPAAPALAGAPNLKDVMAIDLRNSRRLLEQGGDFPYWAGKGLHRVIKLMDVAEQQGDMAARDRLLQMLKTRMEEWMSGKSSKTYFAYNEKLGTMLAYPEQYFFAEQMNDHHFHYGYWIRAAAEIALRDPEWASKSKWGGLIDKLVADIAHPVRGDKSFPFLRVFDPYEGHSWASGVGLGDTGNNQESSSEALLAWTGLILWGEVNGDKAVRDLGVYLYTTEVQAVDHYWFNVHGLVFPPEYKNVDSSMVFGGKYAHNTWWTDEPRQITGINMLPLTTSSTYLGRYPAYVQKNLDALKEESATYAQFGKLPPNPPPRDIWQDVFAKYQALIDPTKALATWDRWGSVELGESRTDTLSFMLNLHAMGRPDFSVSANTPLYSVFKRADGTQTHMAYNASSAPIDVKFSDGKSLRVMPRTLGVLK